MEPVSLLMAAVMTWAYLRNRPAPPPAAESAPANPHQQALEALDLARRRALAENPLYSAGVDEFPHGLRSMQLWGDLDAANKYDWAYEESRGPLDRENEIIRHYDPRKVQFIDNASLPAPMLVKTVH